MMKVLIATISCIVLLASCMTDNNDGASPNVFHYNQHNNITSLDPAYAKSQNNIWAVNHIYSTLLRLDDTLNIKPGIAKSWKVSDDAKTYTFTLKDDILFHDNQCFTNIKERRVTAHDVVYSYDRLMDTVLNAPGSWIFAGKITDDRPFEAIDDTTFVLRLKSSFAPLLSLLTMQYCSIVPQEAVDYYGADFYTHPVGTGPFKFKRWLSNQGLFLLKNEQYYDKTLFEHNNIEGVRTSFIGERSIAFLELVNRRIDFFTGLESSYINTALNPDGTLRDQYRDQMKFIKAPYLNFEYLGLNPSAPDAHPLLAERSFRQALNYGIDRALMLLSLRNNIGVPADAGVITRGLPSYDPTAVKGYAYDKTKARDILSSFDPLLLETPLVIHTSKDYLDLTTYIAKQWEDLGLIIKIDVMESAVLRNAMRNGDVGVFRASWIADYPDGENFLSMFYSKNPAPPNYTRYQNASFDQLYDSAMQERVEKEKILMYQEMDRLLVQDAPVVFLFYDEVSLFVNSDVSGLSRNALNLLHVDGIMKRQ